MNMSVRANRNRQKRRQTGTSDSSQKPRLPATSSFLPAAMSMPGDFNTSVSLTPGFQKSSANTTRSAEEKVRPMLAAVMDSTATACLSDSWNCWHRSSRSAEEVEPSMRMCCTCCGNQGRKRGGLPHAPGLAMAPRTGPRLLLWLKCSQSIKHVTSYCFGASCLSYLSFLFKLKFVLKS